MELNELELEEVLTKRAQREHWNAMRFIAVVAIINVAVWAAVGYFITYLSQQ